MGGKYRSTVETKTPEMQMIAGLLLQAAHDYSRLQAGQKCADMYEAAENRGYTTPACELLAFFGSRWCRNLCEWMGVPHRAYLEYAMSRNNQRRNRWTSMS